MPSRRVLHVHDWPPRVLGGAEVLMARMCDLMRDAGWEVRTFTEADLPDPRQTAFRYLHNRVATEALQKTLADYRPDVVHLHNFYHLLSPAILPVLASYKRNSNARIVATAHDYHLVCPNSGGNWFRRGPRLADVDRLPSWRYLLTRKWDHRGVAHSLLKLSQHVWHYRLHDRRRTIDLVLCTCRFLRELIERVGVPAVHLPNPNPPAAQQSVARSRLLTFAFAGRIEPEKGLRRFLEILPSSCAARLVVIGDGSDRAACEKICAERGLGNRVQFLGRRSHEETVAAIAAAHVVVVPSLLFETYPLVAQEALTVGTNILVADYGGMREIVLDAGIGYRFHPDKAESLVEQCRAIQARFEAGTLNSFDPSGFLSVRTEGKFLEGLLRAYGGGST